MRGIPKEVKDSLRLGGWFRRLPRDDPENIRAPNEGSQRPPDIHPHVWSGVGQYPQARELACRENEENGVGPPEVPTHIFEIIPEEAQQKITEAIVRALLVAEKVKPAAVVRALLNIAKEMPEGNNKYAASKVSFQKCSQQGGQTTQY